MKRKKAGLSEAVQILNNRLNTHIGPGPEEHVLANRDQAGFVSAKDYIRILGSIGVRTHINDGTDILTLSAGHYWGSNLKNSIPNNSNALTFVDVDGTTDGQLEYRLITSYNGRVYYRTQHRNSNGVNSTAPLGWGNFNKYYTLWEGSVRENNVKMALTDNVSKYSGFRITYQIDPIGLRTFDYPNNETLSLEDINVYSQPPTIGFSVYETVLKLSDNTATILSGNKADVVSGSVTEANDLDRITIRKIVGVE